MNTIKLSIVIGLAVFVAAIILLNWRIIGPDEMLVATGPRTVPVSSEEECWPPAPGSIIAELLPGDTARIAGDKYLKECWIIKIELSDNRSGWVTSGNDFEIIEAP
ncbi:MAG: hypothetical protein AAB305_06220 [Candidatus Zixiibacteriota bacterium]